MALFMPSEIARLVLGYLKEAGCVETTTIYMKENPHLSEYVACLKQGHEYPTTIGGKTLLELLNELSSLRTYTQNQTARNDDKTSEIKEYFTRIEERITEYFPRIEERITELKHFASNEALKVNDSDNTVANRIQAAKTTNRILNMISETNQETTKIGSSVIESVTENSVAVVSTGPLTPPLQIDLPCASSEAVIMSSTTPASSISSMSTLCSSGSILRTPTSRPPTINSSPSSIARSAIIFSFGIDALKTPMKDKSLSEDLSLKSPRRKCHLPRKRLSYSPFPTAKKKRPDNIKDASPEKAELQRSNDDNIDVSVLIGQLLNDTALHERIAENINRVVSSSNQIEGHGNNEVASNKKVEDNGVTSKDSETPTKSSDLQVTSLSSETCVTDNVVKDIINQTELDPLYEAFLSSFLEKNENFQETFDSDGIQTPNSHGTPQSQIIVTPTSVRSSVAADSSPCCVSDGVNPNFEPGIIEINHNTALASDTAVNGGSLVRLAVTPKDRPSPNCSRVCGITPYKTWKPLSETKRLSLVGNSPKETVSTENLSNGRQISDDRLNSEVVTAPTTSERIVSTSDRTITYTVLEPVTVGTVIDLSSTNKTTVFVQDLQPQDPSTSSIQTINSLPVQIDVPIVTLYPEQLVPLISGNNMNQREAIEKSETMKAFLEKEQSTMSSLRTVRHNQRFVRRTEDRYRKQLIHIEPKRKQKHSYSAVPLKFSPPVVAISVSKPTSERRSIVEQPKATKGPNSDSDLKVTANSNTKLMSLLTTAKTFKTIDMNTNSSHVRVLSFNSCANDSLKSSSSEENSTNKSKCLEGNGSEKDLVTALQPSETTSKVAKSPLKRKNVDSTVDKSGGKPKVKSITSTARKPRKQNVQKEKSAKDSTTRDSSELDVGYFLSRLRYAE